MSTIREEKIRSFWVLSLQWRGDPRFGSINIGELLTQLADLGGRVNSLGWVRLEDQVATLLNQVINNKRNRKKKSPNNVVNLLEHRVIQPRVLLDMARKDGPDSLVGKTIRMQISPRVG